MNDPLKEFPGPSVNNSRAIIRNLYKRFNDHPSEMLQQKIERIVGYDCDWTDADAGEGPRGGDNN
jgi:hypothetical protein